MRVLERLAAGEVVLTLGVRGARTADIARMARSAGYGAIWIDLEHSSMPIDCAVQIAAAAEDLGLEAWARIPERDYGLVGRLLDGGVGGIIAPRVETVEEAREVVMAARFPPRGRRSQIALLPQFGFRRLPATELTAAADERTTVQILLESARGIDNAEAIAALDGVDLLAVGLNDLSADLGCLGEHGHEKLRDACRRVAAAAARHRKLAVVGGVADPDHYRSLVAQGIAPLVFAGIDTDVLASGIGQRATDWRARLAVTPTAAQPDPSARAELRK
jgi:2-keto-3-deoxy-L-rhamnonate aldolase RhmA